jgi:hypothetical protein
MYGFFGVLFNNAINEFYTISEHLVKDSDKETP